MQTKYKVILGISVVGIIGYYIYHRFGSKVPVIDNTVTTVLPGTIKQIQAMVDGGVVPQIQASNQITNREALRYDSDLIELENNFLVRKSKIINRINEIDSLIQGSSGLINRVDFEKEKLKISNKLGLLIAEHSNDIAKLKLKYGIA